MTEKTLLERMAAETCKSFTGPLYGHPHTCPEQGKKVHQYCYPCKLRAALAEEAPMTDLDPAPYRRMMADQRYASRAVAPETIALVFDPRRQYEQDESVYAPEETP